jgi:hypothetical protein
MSQQDLFEELPKPVKQKQKQKKDTRPFWPFWPIGETVLNDQRLREIALGCPMCGSKEPTHLQVRGARPPHCWRCSCGVEWAGDGGKAYILEQAEGP